MLRVLVAGPVVRVKRDTGTPFSRCSHIDLAVGGGILQSLEQQDQVPVLSS
jgi:hypothetical protein